MANRAYLFFSDSEKFPEAGEQNAVLAANYQIPILWLCMFDPSNIRPTETPLEDFDGNPSTALIPQMSVTKQRALEKCESRRKLVITMLPQALHHHFEEWITFLSAQPQPFLHLDVSEIWCMFDAGEFDGYLERLLKACESNNLADWIEILEQANIDPPGPAQKFNAEVARFGLRGYGWDTKELQ